jgi:ABC-type transporter Mla subunit MlaD
MDWNVLFGAITGPLGALALSTAILYWLATKVVPILQAYLEGQNEKLHDLVRALEKTVDSHEADRKTFESAISGLTQRLDNVEDDVRVIKQKIV